jgi:pre-mRNA-splicing factor CDC5/CEF1
MAAGLSTGGTAAAALSGPPYLACPRWQVSEAELEAIARMGVDAALEASVAEGAGGDATRTLLGAYGATPAARLGLGPGATPMRTPRAAAAGGDRIMAEAAALARLQVGLGGVGLCGGGCHGCVLGSGARGLCWQGLPRGGMLTRRSGSACTRGCGGRVLSSAAVWPCGLGVQGMGTVLEGGESGVDVAAMDFAGVTPRQVRPGPGCAAP